MPFLMEKNQNYFLLHCIERFKKICNKIPNALFHIEYKHPSISEDGIKHPITGYNDKK